MLDYQLAALVLGQLNAGLPLRGINDVTVQRSMQPRQAAVPDETGMFYKQVSSHSYGWPQYQDAIVDDQIITAMTQVQHTRINIGALQPESPATPTGLTSRDLATIGASILNAETALVAYKMSNASVLRIDNVIVTPFQDDKAQNMLWASFDIIFTHLDAFTQTGGRITHFVPAIQRV